MDPEQETGIPRDRDDRLFDDSVDNGLGRWTAFGVKPNSKILLLLFFRFRQANNMDDEDEGYDNGGGGDIVGVGPSLHPHRSQHLEFGVKDQRERERE